MVKMSEYDFELNPHITNGDFIAAFQKCGIPYTNNIRNDRIYSLELSNAVCRSESHAESDSENKCSRIQCNYDTLNVHTLFGGVESIDFYKVQSVKFCTKTHTFYIYENGMREPWMTIEIKK